MIALKPQYANFNFDSDLALPDYKVSIKLNDRINRTLRHLFFWSCNEGETLLIDNNKESISLACYYCDLVKKRQGKNVFFTTEKEQDVHFWWGDLSTEEKWVREKKINSKFTSSSFEKDLGIDVSQGVIRKFKSDLTEGDSLVVKKEHGFAGQGMVYSKGEGDYLFEKKLSRQRDFTTIISDDFWCAENLVTRKGVYRGTIYYENNDNELENALREKHEKVFTKYKEKFNCTYLQIDSFTYDNNGRLSWRYLCEVNHRKSMGWVTRQLAKQFGVNHNYAFFLLPKNIASNIQYKNDDSIVVLSHQHEFLQSLFIHNTCHQSFEQKVSSICHAALK